MLGAIVQYVESLPNWASGMTYGPWVRILARCKNDLGLLAHELLHVQQFWYGVLAFICWIPAFMLLPVSMTICLVLSVFVLASMQRKTLILMAESDAYKLQLRVTTQVHNLSPQEAQQRAVLFADFLSSRYGLNLTPAQALLRIV